MKFGVLVGVGFVNPNGVPVRNFIWEDLSGKPILLHIINMIKRSRFIDKVIPYYYSFLERKEETKLKSLLERYNITAYIRPLPDYCEGKFWEPHIELYRRTGLLGGPEEWGVVATQGSPHPLVNTELIDGFIESFLSSKLDYLNVEGLPRGLGIELLNIRKWFDTLPSIDPNGKLMINGTILSLLRSGTFDHEFPGLLKTKVVKAEGIYNEPKLKLQVDSPGQVKLLRKVYDKFYKKDEEAGHIKDVIALYKEDPSWFEILFLDQLEIEVTNDCNLKCIMCPRTTKMNREVGYMDYNLFKKIIDKTDVMSIHFSGLGEPLLHPQIKEMFAYGKEKGLEIGLWTSGLELTEELSEEIIDKGFLDYIIFGLDVARSDTYAKVKGVDTFDKVVENINRFLELKKEILKDAPKYYGSRKPLVGVQIVKTKENDQEIEQFMEKWDFQEKVKKMINYRNRIQKEPVVDRELWETLYDKFLPVEHTIIGHFNNYCSQIEDRSVIDVTPLKRFPCQQLKKGIFILWNGDVVLCRQDFDGKYPLGNLKGQNLEEILESERLKDIWQAHKDGEYEKLSLCAGCKEWYYNLYA